jgi:hypothetical protein
MSDTPHDQDENAEVDLDLDAEDTLLREALGKPVTVRVGGKVISVPHSKAWPHTANTAARIADFDNWAALVLSPEDYKVFDGANLKNYQVDALFEAIRKHTGMGPGKSPSSQGSSRSTRKR